jgi:signal transduction histidine kinase
MQNEFARGAGHRLFAPLSIAAYVTWFAVLAAALEPARLAAGELLEWTGLGLLLAVLGLFAWLARCSAGPADGASPRAWAAVLLQGACVLAAEACLRSGSVAILLIVVAAQLFTLLPRRAALVVIAVLNAILLASWAARGISLAAALPDWLAFAGFQAFAALTAMYAQASEQGRTALAAANAELAAAQRLLEAGARTDERLRLSRELHDVAGHKLTALKLTLRSLQRDPTLAGREDVALSYALADELLTDIRGVVSALRDADGVALGPALAALVRPLPGVHIELSGHEDVNVNGIGEAEALLRVAQEGLTNAIRHGHATRVRVTVGRDADGVALAIEDDGRGRLPLTEGHGITGMRERLAALGGRLAVEQREPRGLRVAATIPARAA